MTEPSTPSSLYREQSLVQRRQRDQRPLPLRRGVTRWGFPLLITGLVAVAVIATVVELDETAVGWVAPGAAGEVVVVLPVTVAPDVRPGQRLRTHVGDRRLTGSITAVRGPAPVSDAVRLLGREPGVTDDAGAVLLTTARVEAAVPDRGAKAEVRLRRRTLAQLLLPRLRSAFGQRRA